jgi:pimeloyl-ACP methyl ester carboxylesterase
MGCLVAMRVARLRPDLVRHLILYEMPLYSGLPDKRRYRARLKLYFNLYERIIAFKPIFHGPGKKRAQKLAEKIVGFTLDDETWKPFIRSLKHTIMEQTTAEDIKQVKTPMDAIYGTRDQLVIRGKVHEIFGEDAQHVTAHTIREAHIISRKASRFLLSRIVASLESSV